MIKQNSKILITGCGGMLGEGVYQEFFGKSNVFATDIDLNETWLSYLDVSVKEDVENNFNKIKPDYAIHLAALTDLEYCELNADEAKATNSNGTKNVVDLARKQNIPLVYISSAGIFDGKKEYYLEEDYPHPINIYGQSKYEGENFAKAYYKSIIIRAGWMMGGGPKKDKKFINKIIKQIKSGCDQIYVVDDKLGTPTYTYDLAKIIWHLLDKELYGLYHGCCDGGGSRFDVADFMIKLLNLENKVKIVKVDSDYFKKEYFAPRPPSEKLLNTKLKEKGADLTRDWRVCLEEYLKKFNWGIND